MNLNCAPAGVQLIPADDATLLNRPLRVCVQIQAKKIDSFRRHFLHSIEPFRGGRGGTEATKRDVGQFLSNGKCYGYKPNSSAISH